MVYALGLFLSFHEVPDDLLEEYGENAVQSAHENERYEGVRRKRAATTTPTQTAAINMVTRAGAQVSPPRAS
jgi:hypothetical protein